jgi:hypothetical protein
MTAHSYFGILCQQLYHCLNLTFDDDLSEVGKARIELSSELNKLVDKQYVTFLWS